MWTPHFTPLDTILAKDRRGPGPGVGGGGVGWIQNHFVAFYILWLYTSLLGKSIHRTRHSLEWLLLYGQWF